MSYIADQKICRDDINMKGLYKLYREFELDSHKRKYTNISRFGRYGEFLIDKCLLDSVNVGGASEVKGCDICKMIGVPLEKYRDSQGEHSICKVCFKRTNKTTRAETRMSRYLDANFGTEFLQSTDSRVYGNVCQLYRPDKLYAGPTRVIQVECDENQHRNKYDYSCENKRISDIYNEFAGVDYVVIRWNPHRSKTTSMNQGDRLKLLLRAMKLAQKIAVPNKILVIYMFYDRDNELVTKEISKIHIDSDAQMCVDESVCKIYEVFRGYGMRSYEYKSGIEHVDFETVNKSLKLILPTGMMPNVTECIAILADFNLKVHGLRIDVEKIRGLLT